MVEWLSCSPVGHLPSPVIALPWPTQATRVAVGLSLSDARVIAPAAEGADFSADGRFVAITLAEEVRVLETTE